MTLKLLHLAVLSAAAETGCMEGALHILYPLASNSGKDVLVLIYLVRKAFEEKRILFLCQFYHLVQWTKLLSSITSTLVLYCRLQRKKWEKGYLLYLLFLIHTGKQHMTSVYYKCSQLIPYILLLKYERYIYTFS